MGERKKRRSGLGGYFSNTNQAFDCYPLGNSSKEGEMVDFPLGPILIYFVESRGSRARSKRYRRGLNKPEDPD